MKINELFSLLEERFRFKHDINFYSTSEENAIGNLRK